MDETTRQWKLDNSNGGYGCYYPFDSAAIYSQISYVSNTTINYQNVNALVMSSQDPFIILQQITKGKNFGGKNFQ